MANTNEFGYLGTNMQTNVKITITGDKKAIASINNIQNQLEKPKEPLQNSSKLMMAAIMENFKNQGKTFGMPWTPLKPLTVKIKQRLGYGDKPPLVRTGRMKGSFRSKTERNKLIIDNPTPYFPSHQIGSKRIPQRVMLRIDKTRLHLIIDAFRDWVVKIIKKAKK